MTRRRRTRFTLAAALLALGAFVTPMLAPAAAFADSYPSWSDVVKARKSEAAAKQEIAHIRSLISALADRVQKAQAALAAKTAAYDRTQAAYQDKQAETADLEKQAKAAQKRADASEKTAGQWAVQVVKVNSSDPTLNLFIQYGDSAAILSSIGVTRRLSEQANALYEQAEQQKNVAGSLAAQAAAAEAQLKVLSKQAADAEAAAQDASKAASAALDEQQAHQTLLQAQLDVLVHHRAVTEKDYKKGVQKRLQDQIKGIDWAKITKEGWVRPAGGFISAYWGYSAQYEGTGFHHGIDFANPCGSTIIAAHSGTVTFAGWNGELGNYILLDNGGGVWTGYGHQLTGGFKVRVGQHVETGQRIGTVGMTGVATGCHVHLDVYVNGTRINPKPFLAGVGIYV